MSEARHDFENIKDGRKVRLFPKSNNLLHRRPVIATHYAGYFYCDGSRATEGADYYFGDVATHNDHFEVLP